MDVAVAIERLDTMNCEETSVLLLVTEYSVHVPFPLSVARTFAPSIYSLICVGIKSQGLQAEWRYCAAKPA